MERFEKGLETLKKYVTEEEATQLVSQILPNEDLIYSSVWWT